MTTAASRYAKRGETLRQDAIRPVAAIVSWLRRQVSDAFNEMWSGITRAVGAWLDDLLGKRPLDVDLTELESSARDAVQDSIARIHEELVQGLNDASRPLEEVLDAAASKAETSASEGALISAGAVNQAVQIQGYTRGNFFWATMRDERVRPLHVSVGEIVWEWDRPPEDPDTGEQFWPGTQINCRCVAIPTDEQAALDVDVSDL